MTDSGAPDVEVRDSRVARPRVVVCGLGPAGPDMVTRAVVDAVARIDHRFLRTGRHLSASVLGDATTFDAHYESAASIEDVYTGIVDALADAAARHGEVLYAVPGSPAVAERTVELLLADGRVTVDVLPALSFVDLAWVRLGVDPVAVGVRLVDGHRFDSEAAGERGPLLIGQCDTQDVLSDVKLAIDAAVDQATHHGDARDRAAGHDAGHEDGGPFVTVLQRLGLPDESIRVVPWYDLDRVVEPDHLTSVYVPELAAPVAGEVVRFAEVVRRLRAECPWDREQTHSSLRRHLLEEAYEVLEALDHLDVAAGEGFDLLEEELGDLLFQIVFHATLAAEEGRFTLADVARGISEKLIGRHPHVFGDVTVASADEVAERWEQLKKAEKGRASVMDGIPAALPALLYATKVQKKALSQGVLWRELTGPAPESSTGTGAAAPLDHDSIGYELLELVDAARERGDDPETELRIAAEHIRDRFRDRET
jgi:tetrapyrrole methylase family protein / MazG family protein